MKFEANILCYKQEDMTNRLIAQLRETVPQDNLSIIRVWDNSPSPINIIGADEVKHNRFNPSISRSWNYAIGQSLTDWVLVANEDTSLDPGWFQKLLREHEEYPNSLWHGPSRFFFFHKSLLESVGWFDEMLMGNTYEDLDYVRRLNHVGIPMRYGIDSNLNINTKSLKEDTGRELIPNRNLEYMQLKYGNTDTEDFFVPPLFPTPDFYPQRAK